ncbi:MAG: HDOD domain-containing protein [Deltaproteobacteria bacterium]|nr:HDOD domain-containing protein [Deltaproteobacteria bacterium]
MEVMEKIALDNVIARATELPVLPGTAQKVLAMMGDPDVSIEKIKRIIGSDPSLATKILKVANSAFYGGYRNIQNLNQAILRLGLNSVRNIVVATSMKNVYKRFGLAERMLMDQLIGSALISSIIAREARIADPEDAFIGGLLHDIGKVVLNNEYPNEFARVMERVYNDSVPFTAAEIEVFAFSHRELGALIIKKWGFPESLELLLKYFDNHEELAKERVLYNLAVIIRLADIMCQKNGIGWRKTAVNNVEYGNLPDILRIDGAGMDVIKMKIEEILSQCVEFYG